MKRIKISIAVLGLVLGSITSFAFKSQQKLKNCINGPASTTAHCGAPAPQLCCETAGHTIIRAVFVP